VNVIINALIIVRRSYHRRFNEHNGLTRAPLISRNTTRALIVATEEDADCHCARECAWRAIRHRVSCVEMSRTVSMVPSQWALWSVINTTVVWNVNSRPSSVSVGREQLRAIKGF